MEKKFKYGDRLKELRKPTDQKEKQKSMDELCDIFAKEYNLNVNKSMISRWENGSAVPDNKHIVAYAKYFDVDMNYLIGLTNVKRRLSDVQLHENSKKDKIFASILESLNKIDEDHLIILQEMINRFEKLDLETLKAYNKILK